MNTAGIVNGTSNEVAADSYLNSRREKRSDRERIQRLAKSAKTDDDLNSSIASTDDVSPTIAQVLDDRLKEYNDIQEKMFTFNWMMTNGTHSQKRTVQAVMAERLKSASDDTT